MSAPSEPSAFSPEDAPKLGKYCAVTNKPFAPGDKVYSVLYEEDGELKRRDVCASAWRSTPRPANAIAWWASRIQEDAEKDKKLKLAPNDALTALFVSLADKPGKEALRYALALLLARRRVLKFDYEENASKRSSPETANTIYVYSPRNETGYYVPVVNMTPKQIEEVQAQLVALIESPQKSADRTSEEPEELDDPESANPTAQTPSK